MPSDAAKDRSSFDPEQLKNRSFQQGNNHLLVIGIDAYLRVGRLENAVRDAQSLRQLLLSKYQFDPSRVREIYNEAATQRGITQAFRQLVQQVEPGDNVLVYFSGHGHYDTLYQEAYWVPVDAEFEAETDYISYDYLVKVIKSFRAHHVVFVVDSCYSGAALVRGEEKTIRVERDPSRWLLASGRNEVVPDGIAGGHSPFADKLLDILERYAHEGIRMGTLADKLITAVTYNSPQTPIGRPVYGAGDQGGEFVFHPRRDEARDWAAAQSQNTPQTYRQFLAAYPQSAHADAAAWQIACLLDTKAAYRAYLDAQGQGQHRLSASQRILAIEDRDRYKEALELGEGGLLVFVEQYRNSAHRAEALAEIQRIRSQEMEKEQRLREEEVRLERQREAEKQRQEAEEAQRRQQEDAKAKARQEQQRQAEKQRQEAEETLRKQQAEEAAAKEKARLTRQRDAQQNEPERSSWFSRGHWLWLLVAGILGYMVWVNLPVGSQPDEGTQAEQQAIASATPPTDLPLPEMVLIRGGTFTMGSRDVTVRDFWIGKYEVTQAEWRAVMGTDPSSFKNCDQCPVEQVSWEDVQVFIQKLNAQTGQKYRLPTEAEWEYAAGGGENNRTEWAGTNAEGSLGNYAWYNKNSGDKTHPIGQKDPNALKLYDMSGNVWEWCADWLGDYPSGAQTNPQGPSAGSNRVFRGGSWYGYPAFCRVAYRGYSSPGDRGGHLGFRLAGTP